VSDGLPHLRGDSRPEADKKAHITLKANFSDFAEVVDGGVTFQVEVQEEHHSYDSHEEIIAASSNFNEFRTDTYVDHGTEQVDPMEITIERELFLSMLRSEYWAQMESGSLPDNSEAAQILLHSVDVANDATGLGLVDWTQVFLSIFGSPLVEKLPESLQWIYSQFIKPIVKLPSKVFGLKVYVPCDVNGLRFDAFTCVCFVDAHYSVQGKILEGLGSPSKARKHVLEESYDEAIAMLRLIDEHVGVDGVIEVRTKQLAHAVLSKEKNLVHEWERCGILTTTEAENLVHPVHHDMNKLVGLFRGGVSAGAQAGISQWKEAVMNSMGSMSSM
jgi:hypothetical protein